MGNLTIDSMLKNLESNKKVLENQSFFLFSQTVHISIEQSKYKREREKNKINNIEYIGLLKTHDFKILKCLSLFE